MTKHISLKWY